MSSPLTGSFGLSPYHRLVGPLTTGDLVQNNLNAQGTDTQGVTGGHTRAWGRSGIMDYKAEPDARSLT